MNPFKHGPLALVIAIPLAAVVMGIITVVLALSYPDTPMAKPDDALPLTKTSWRNPDDG